MPSVDSFSTTGTNLELNCPDDTTGIERIMLAATGNLQRFLSAFLSRPISIKTIYTHTSPRTAPASPEHPITQSRQVHLMCSGRTVCIATSTVTLTSPTTEKLLLDDKYPIGQLFRRLQRIPDFTLLNVQTKEIPLPAGKDDEPGTKNVRRELSRLYRLEVEGIRCDILEEFGDRDIFIRGRDWIDEQPFVVSGPDDGKPYDEIDADNDKHGAHKDEYAPDPTPANSFEGPTPIAIPAKKTLFSYTPHNATNTFPALTLSAILDKQANDPVTGARAFAAYPDFANISSTGEIPFKEITYKNFATLVNKEARRLYELLKDHTPQPEPGTEDGLEAPTVAVLEDSGFLLALRVLALLKLNVTVFLLAPFNSEAAITHLLKTCSVSTLLAGPKYEAIGKSASQDLSSKVVVLDGEVDAGIMKDAGNTNVTDPEEGQEIKPLYPIPATVPVIIHSSGSTSFPKPVRWTNASFLSNSQIMLSSGDWSAFTNPENRFLCLGPLFHTMGLTIGLAGTVCAGTTIMFPLTNSWPPSPSDIARSLKTMNAKTCIIVPLLLEQLVDVLEADGGDVLGGTDEKKGEDRLERLKQLNLLLVGGAHCPEKLASRIVTRGVNLKSVYGSSETGHLMVGLHTRPAEGDTSSWNLVRPFPHTSIILKPMPYDGPTSDDEKPVKYQVHMDKDDVRLAFGVLKEGEETWNTGDVVEEFPKGSGFFRLLYRDDDILVHVSGEKTNPVPMETSCRSHKLVSRIAIVGHRRPVTAAIVQLDANEAALYNDKERTEIVKEIVREANKEAPSHSHVLEEMILVLPVGGEKAIPITAKGNCIRPKVLQAFSGELDALYKEFEGEITDNASETASSSADTDSTVNITLGDIQEQVSKTFAEVIKKPTISSSDLDKNLFDIGLDSITAMQLRTRLVKAFGLKLSAQFVYQNFTLELLSKAIFDLAVGASSGKAQAEPAKTHGGIDKEKGENLWALLQKQIETVKAAAPGLVAGRTLPLDVDNQVVAVVGAAGSLGIWQIKCLLDREDVKQVVCLVRGKDDEAVFKKISAGFTKAGLDELANQTEGWMESQVEWRREGGKAVVNLEQRLVVVPFDLGGLGKLEKEEFEGLARGLTMIIHTGWKMDFNQPVKAFEKDCLDGTTELVLLAGTTRPKRFYFVSSIGVVLESKRCPVPEELPPWTKDDYVMASPHGYSESKFVSEYAIEEASKLLGIACSAVRVGQITGDSAAGVWKTAEMNPIIIAGSSRIGKYPVVDGAILDWTPVDTVGQSTIDLAFREQEPGYLAIHHISNPVLSTYAEMVQNLCKVGVNVQPVSPKEWWAAIQQDEGNPCLAIEAYIEEAVVNAHAELEKTGGQSVTLEITKTKELAPNSLGKCPPLDAGLWKKYVDYWRSVGFLKA